MGETNQLYLNDSVTLAISGEKGRVIGLANYVEGAPQFQVHYQDVHGAARTDWFVRHELEGASV